MSFPEVSERLSHEMPTWFVREKRVVAYFVADHHDDGYLGFMCPAPDGVQAELIEAEPDRFYRPPYFGHRGWIGVHLAEDCDWDEVREILLDAYRKVAPKVLAAQLEAGKYPGE